MEEVEEAALLPAAPTRRSGKLDRTVQYRFFRRSNFLALRDKPKTNATPTFHTANAAVDYRDEPLGFVFADVAGAEGHLGIARNKITPRMLVAKIRRSVATEIGMFCGVPQISYCVATAELLALVDNLSQVSFTMLKPAEPMVEGWGVSDRRARGRPAADLSAKHCGTICLISEGRALQGSDRAIRRSD